MKVVVFGGAGFIGKRLVAKLADSHEVTVLTRNRERVKRDLIVLPTVDVVESDINAPGTLDRIMKGKDIAINLIGILNENRRMRFENIHVDFVRKLADSAVRNDLRQIIHVSALNAMSGAPSQYLRSKGKGESLITKISDTTRYTIFRPSVVFGEEDGFVNLFLGLVRKLPVIMLPCHRARFQPIWVDDLADLIAMSIGNRDFYGQIVQAGGPDELSLAQVIAMIARHAGKRRIVIPLGSLMSRVTAALSEKIPFVDLLTLDNVASMEVPSVCSNNGAMKHLPHMTSLEAELQRRFGNSRLARSHYKDFRQRAGR